MTTANQTSRPPMVGVPALVWWRCGPSSRMFWPNSLLRSQRMKAGPMTSTRTIAVTLAPIALSIARLRPAVRRRGAGRGGGLRPVSALPVLRAGRRPCRRGAASRPTRRGEYGVGDALEA